MDIQLKQIISNEFDSLFSVVKQGLFTHVDSVFGWCDEFQSNRLKNDYEPHRFHWVYLNDMRVGILCFKPYDNSLHVHLLIVFPEFQNQKIGERVMNMVHEIAHKQGRTYVTLSSFVINQRAISFYQSLGYQVTESDESFVSLSLNITS
ncbi:GNAT family N-acetyltransferase [Vibrio tetraodonis]|nr:GNAT family N-acetyltransferase [Vibrio tetraodonis]